MKKKYKYKSIINNFPIEIKYNILKYGSNGLLKYFIKKKIKTDWEKLYRFLYGQISDMKILEPEIKYLYPIKYKNIWLNAINNHYPKKENKYEDFKITKKNKLMARGENKNGRLGLKGFNYRNKFEFVKNGNGKPIKNVANVFCDKFSTVLLLTTGKIMSTGNNDFGQLGFGDCVCRYTFQLVNNDDRNQIIGNVSSIFFGSYNTFLLLKSGKILACGSNNNGQLGLEGVGSRSPCRFQLINNVDNAINIFCGSRHTIILLKNGKIMVSGCNEHKKLGVGDNASTINKFELVKDQVDKDIENVANVFLHEEMTMLLLKNGKVMACGSNLAGQLGLGGDWRNKFELVPFVKNAINIFLSTGSRSVILLKTGEIMVCGFNFHNYTFELVPNINNVVDVKFIEISKLKESAKLIFRDGSSTMFHEFAK